MTLHKSHSGSRIRSNIVVYTGLIVASLLVVLPFAIILVTSFKSITDAQSWEFSLVGKEDGLTVQGYKLFFKYSDYDTGIPWLLTGFLNTMITSLVPTIGSLFFGALAAFAFAKIKFRMSKPFFAVILFTMMIPGTILMIPHYLMYESFGWIDTFLPLIVPGFFGGASLIFFLRQFMYGVPDSVIEAGKIDGLSWPGIFIRIMLPLVVPALLAQGLLGFIGHYNAYLGPLLYLRDPGRATLQLVVANFKSAAMGTSQGRNYPALMACCIVTIMPILILYTIFQKYFVDGIATSGMKL